MYMYMIIALVLTFKNLTKQLASHCHAHIIHMYIEHKS